MLDRVEPVNTALQDYAFNTLMAETRFRSQDGSYRFSPAVLWSESIVAGVTPPELAQHVEDDLGKAGDWKSDPERPLAVVIETAKAWRTAEALEGRSGKPNVPALGNDSTRLLQPRNGPNIRMAKVRTSSPAGDPGRPGI